MFAKTLLAAAVLAAIAATPAQACVETCGGIKFNGISLNGVKFNGPGLTVQGIALNGLSIQGLSIQGTKFNGYRWNGPGINVGGHQGVSLNGNVIAIEF